MPDGYPINIVRIPFIEQVTKKLAPILSADGKRLSLPILIEFNTGDVLVIIKSVSYFAW
jgi:hypothetical protein